MWLWFEADRGGSVGFDSRGVCWPHSPVSCCLFEGCGCETIRQVQRQFWPRGGFYETKAQLSAVLSRRCSMDNWGQLRGWCPVDLRP